MDDQELETEVLVTKFLDANPIGYRVSPPPPETAPKIPVSISFYDSHVDDPLHLKRVAVLPSLKNRLAANLPKRQEPSNRIPDATLSAALRYNLENTPSLCPTSAKLATKYSTHMFQHVSILATTFYFAEELKEWKTALGYRRVNNTQKYPFVTDSYGLTIAKPDGYKSAWKSLPEDVQDLIDRATQHCPAAAIIQFYDDSPISDSLMKDMDKLDFSPQSFPSDDPSVSGFVRQNIPPHGDVENSSIVNKLLASRGRGRKATSNQETLAPRRKKAKRRTDLPAITLHKPADSVTPKYVSPADLAPIMIRRAWTRAVAANASFVIFNSGKFERIGIRDRENQILYLSELIEVKGCSKYYKILTGLYLSILGDVLERTRKHWKPPAKPRALGSTHGAQRRSRSLMIQMLQSRRVALISMQFNGLNSSTPTVFFRLEADQPVPVAQDKVSYKANEYFHLTIVSEIAQGATGIVHDAIVELSVGQGSVRQIRAIIKLAFTPRQSHRLRREFSIYKHLSAHKVEGIPCVYGLFKHSTTNLHAMIMDHAGESLLTLYRGVYAEGQDSAILSPLSHQFCKILNDVHKAGVLHRDIRPENLTLDENGYAHIIDFDNARLDPTQEQKVEDMNCLELVLEGERNPGFMTASKTPTSLKTSDPDSETYNDDEG